MSQQPRNVAFHKHFRQWMFPLEVPQRARFAAADVFLECQPTSVRTPSVKISHMTEAFRTELLPKVELDVPRGSLTFVRLLKPASNDTIALALEAKQETYLADFWHLLTLQPNGEPGRLLTHGKVSMAFVQSVRQATVAVYARWYADSRTWGLGCIPTGAKVNFSWDTDDLVAFR